MPFLIIIPIILTVILVIFTKNKKENYGERDVSAEVRGTRGENSVRRIIGDTIENQQYVINGIIVSNEGKTSQIDHVVINQCGVFVIETKNYSGEIYGSEKQREWTQVLSYGKVKNKIYNPLKQNASHVYNVRKIVGNLPIRSLVVFVQNNTSHIHSANVIPLSALRNTLQCGDNVLSPAQMRTAYDALLASRTEITIEQHVCNIKEQQRNIELGICPRCGGKLVLRNGKYGKFWGCSNYPKCKFIKKP